jgi:hypothetical protein
VFVEDENTLRLPVDVSIDVNLPDTLDVKVFKLLVLVSNEVNLPSCVAFVVAKDELNVVYPLTDVKTT